MIQGLQSWDEAISPEKALDERGSQLSKDQQWSCRRPHRFHRLFVVCSNSPPYSTPHLKNQPSPVSARTFSGEMARWWYKIHTIYTILVSKPERTKATSQVWLVNATWELVQIYLIYQSSTCNLVKPSAKPNPPYSRHGYSDLWLDRNVKLKKASKTVTIQTQKFCAKHWRNLYNGMIWGSTGSANYRWRKKKSAHCCCLRAYLCRYSIVSTVGCWGGSFAGNIKWTGYKHVAFKRVNKTHHRGLFHSSIKKKFTNRRKSYLIKWHTKVIH